MYRQESHKLWLAYIDRDFAHCINVVMYRQESHKLWLAYIDGDFAGLLYELEGQVVEQVSVVQLQQCEHLTLHWGNLENNHVWGYYRYIGTKHGKLYISMYRSSVKETCIPILRSIWIWSTCNCKCVHRRNIYNVFW